MSQIGFLTRPASAYSAPLTSEPKSPSLHSELCFGNLFFFFNFFFN